MGCAAVAPECSPFPKEVICPGSLWWIEASGNGVQEVCVPRLDTESCDLPKKGPTDLPKKAVEVPSSWELSFRDDTTVFPRTSGEVVEVAGEVAELPKEDLAGYPSSSCY